MEDNNIKTPTKENVDREKEPELHDIYHKVHIHDIYYTVYLLICY